MKGFSKTKSSNLIRNDASGIYYAYARTGSTNGKLSRRAISLRTTSLETAKLWLPGKLALLHAGRTAVKVSTYTLGFCAGVYLENKRAQGRRGKLLKQSSLDYRTETVHMLRKTWPGFDKISIAGVKLDEVRAWANRARAKYSPTRFNGMLESLRGCFEVALEADIVAKNLALKVDRAAVVLMPRFVPTREQFTAILARLDDHPRRKFATIGVRALAFTSLRPKEARNLVRSDVDLAQRTLLARVTKNGDPRVVHLIDQAVELFESEGVDKVLAALKMSPRKALRTVARELKLDQFCAEKGFKPMSPYTFRKLYLTRMIECGVDIIVSANTAGHRDKGRTLLNSYVQPRAEHIREQVRKVIV